MKTYTNIEQLFTGSTISVPRYQRAYSWDEDNVKTFFSDLCHHSQSSSQAPYYLGHFIFEKGNDSNSYFVIDGQQRLTTVQIFLAELFREIEKKRKLSESEISAKENIVICNGECHFHSVDYDNVFFRQVAIDATKDIPKKYESVSQKRIADAIKIFRKLLSKKSDEEIKNLLDIVKKSSCTTHIVSGETDAVQMFIFQNNRGKTPSNLEIIKAQFMFQVHLECGTEAEETILEIKNKFEKIYKSISKLDGKIDEDNVLRYTSQIYFDSLLKTGDIETIEKEISKKDSIDFIKEFTSELETSFENLCKFFEMENNYFAAHSFIALSSFTIAMPFILKAYKYNNSTEQILELCTIFENIILRNNIVGTRASLENRVNGCFENFKSAENFSGVIDWIESLLHDNSGNWWDYWNDKIFKNCLHGYVSPHTAKFVLWQYENHLLEQNGEKLIPYSKMNYLDPRVEVSF